MSFPTEIEQSCSSPGKVLTALLCSGESHYFSSPLHSWRKRLFFKSLPRAWLGGKNPGAWLPLPAWKNTAFHWTGTELIQGFLGAELFQYEDVQAGNWSDLNPWAWPTSETRFCAQVLKIFHWQGVFLCFLLSAKVCFFHWPFITCWLWFQGQWIGSGLRVTVSCTGLFTLY